MRREASQFKQSFLTLASPVSSIGIRYKNVAYI